MSDFHKRIVRIALLTAVIVFLILFASGFAVSQYGVLRFRYAPERVQGMWWLSLLHFALFGGIVAGALAAAWRLINPKEARWSTLAFVLVVALFASLVWPTPWTYRQFGCEVYQVNRFVGTWAFITKLPACEAEAARSVIQHPAGAPHAANPNQ